MASLKIRIYAQEELKTTVTLPLFLISTAFKFVPKKVKADLEADGIDIESIINANKENFIGTVVDIEKHDENSRIVISLE
ncbi:MAG TPA: hypothetical protein VN809_14555 [Telmatospirillum sp.]|nr:hypothetical protein [Telmatospirillum sp.]